MSPPSVRALVMLSSLATGGSERNVVAMLPQLEQWGVDVALCTLNRDHDGPLAADFERSGVHRHDLAAKRLLDPSGWRKLRRLLDRNAYDVIHTEDQYSNILGGTIGRAAGIGVVMTRHVVRENTNNARSAAKARLDFLVARLTADRVITVSEQLRGQYARDAKITRSRLVTVHNGLDLDRWRRQHSVAEARDLLGWPRQQPVVVMVAVLREGKGHEVLLRAVPEIRRTAGSSVSFKIVGSGDREPELRRAAAPHGDAVELLGERRDVPTILEASDILVLPSWSEAFPTVLLEAGAIGIPVVATRVGGVEEIVADGDTGFLVAPGDADALARRVTEVLSAPTRAHEMGQRANARIASRFSITGQAAATAALYRQVVVERSARTRTKQRA